MDVRTRRQEETNCQICAGCAHDQEHPNANTKSDAKENGSRSLLYALSPARQTYASFCAGCALHSSGGIGAHECLGPLTGAGRFRKFLANAKADSAEGRWACAILVSATGRGWRRGGLCGWCRFCDRCRSRSRLRSWDGGSGICCWVWQGHLSGLSLLQVCRRSRQNIGCSGDYHDLRLRLQRLQHEEGGDSAKVRRDVSESLGDACHGGIFLTFSRECNRTHFPD